MKRHPLDLVSLVLGMVVLVIGVAALTGDLGELVNRPAAAVPLALGLVGLAAISSVRRAAEPRPPLDEDHTSLTSPPV